MEESNNEDTPQQDDQNNNPEMVINQSKLNKYLEDLKFEQNVMQGLIYGIAAALIGAILWAVVTVATGYQIGYMAIAVGFIVGYAVRMGGKGIDPIFGIMGAILALVGSVLGNFFSLIGVSANQIGLSYTEMLSQIDYAEVPNIMIETFSPMDIIFYGFAVYQGYKSSFRQVTDEEIIEHAGEKVIKSN